MCYCVNESKKPLKAEGNHFYSNLLTILAKFNGKTSLLVRSDILGLLDNTSSADDKYLIIIGRIYSNQFKCNYLKSQNNFVHILFNFQNLHKTLNILNKNMNLIA